MAAAFNLTAQLNLQGPTNIGAIVSNIKKQLNNISANVNVKISPGTSQNVAALNSAFASFNATLATTATNSNNAANAIRGLTTAIGQANNPLNNLQQNMTNNATAAAQLTQNLQNLNRTQTRCANDMEELGRQAAGTIRRFAAFGVVTGLMYKVGNSINSASKEFLEFNRELVRVAQVTDTSLSNLTSLTKQISNLSTTFGVASSDLIKVSSTLAQAGLSAKDTEKALKALALSALAPSFDSLNDTVEGSIALMRQFGIGADQLEGALGSVNAVAAKFAVEASDIITAIQRTGGVFATASKGVATGTEALNQFISVFTSIRATTRESAETIATGLRTIFTRIQRGQTVEALKEYGVVLTDLEGKFVGPYEATKRLSEGLSRLDPRDLRFGQIVEELGGFRQIGKVIPLIQQFAVAQQALKVAQQGQASLAYDAATAQESVANKMTKVREEFVALIRSIGDSTSFQTFVKLSLDLTSQLIRLADAAKNVLPALAAIAVARSAGNAISFGRGFVGGLRRNQGGPIGFASGGFVPGQGNSDTVPAMLTPGEFVIRKKAVKAIGTDRLAGMNKYAGGGIVEDLNKGVGAAVLEYKPNKFTSGTFSVKIPGQKNKIVTGIKEGLNKETNETFHKALDEGIIRGVNYATRIVSQDLGIPSKKVGKGEESQKFLSGINDASRGNLFEDILRTMKGGPFGNTEAQRPFDFPEGLTGVIKDNFTNLPNKWVDAKASFDAAKLIGPSSLQAKTQRQIDIDMGVNSLTGRQRGIQSGKALGRKDLIKILGLKNDTSEDMLLSRAKEAQYIQNEKTGNWIKKALGGNIEKFAKGGSSEDTVPALLTPGEFVINRKAASRIGLPALHKMNHADKIQGFNKGGVVQGFASGGLAGGMLAKGLVNMRRMGQTSGGFDFASLMGGQLALSQSTPFLGGEGSRGATTVQNTVSGAMTGAAVGSASSVAIAGILRGLSAMPGPLGVLAKALSFAAPLISRLGGAAIGATLGWKSVDKSMKQYQQTLDRKQAENLAEQSGKTIDEYINKPSAAKRSLSYLELKNTGRAEGAAAGAVEYGGPEKFNEYIKNVQNEQKAGTEQATKLLFAEMTNTGKTFAQLRASMKPEEFDTLTTNIAESSAEYIDAQRLAAIKILQFADTPQAEQVKKEVEAQLKALAEQIAGRAAKTQEQIGIDAANAKRMQQAFVKLERAILGLSESFDIMQSQFDVTEFNIDKISKSADEAISGKTNFENRSPFGQQTNILQNQKNYTTQEVAMAKSAAASNLGASGQQIIAASNLVDNITNKLSSSINQMGGRGQRIMGGETETATISSSLAQTIKQELANVLPQGTNEYHQAMADLDKAIQHISDMKPGEQGQTLGDIQDSLTKVFEDISKKANQTLIKSSQATGKSFNELTNNSIKLAEAQAKQRDLSIDFNSTQLRQKNSLDELIGPMTTGAERVQRNFAESAAKAGYSNPAEYSAKSLMTKKSSLEQQREGLKNQLALPQTAQAFEQLTRQIGSLDNEIAKVDKDLPGLSQSLESAMSNVMSEMQKRLSEINASNEAKVGIAEKAVTSSPEELIKVNSAFITMQQVLNGNVLTIERSREANIAYFKALQQGKSGQEAFNDAQMAFVQEKETILSVFEQAARAQGMNEEQIRFKKADLLEGLARGSGPIALAAAEPGIASLRKTNAQLSDEDPQMKLLKGMYNQINNEQNAIYGFSFKLNKQLIGILEATGADIINQIKNTPIRMEASLGAAAQARQASPRSKGGIIYASSGKLINFQPKGTDTVPAMLTPGEFVVNAQATKGNLPLLHSINRARGGIIPVSQRRDLPAERDKRAKAVSEANAAKEQRYKDIMAARRKTYGIDEPKKSSKPTNLGELARKVNSRNQEMKQIEINNKKSSVAVESTTTLPQKANETKRSKYGLSPESQAILDEKNKNIEQKYSDRAASKADQRDKDRQAKEAVKQATKTRLAEMDRQNEKNRTSSANEAASGFEQSVARNKRDAELKVKEAAETKQRIAAEKEASETAARLEYNNFTKLRARAAKNMGSLSKEEQDKLALEEVKRKIPISEQYATAYQSRAKQNAERMGDTEISGVFSTSRQKQRKDIQTAITNRKGVNELAGEAISNDIKLGGGSKVYADLVGGSFALATDPAAFIPGVGGSARAVRATAGIGAGAINTTARIGTRAAKSTMQAGKQVAESVAAAQAKKLGIKTARQDLEAIKQASRFATNEPADMARRSGQEVSEKAASKFLGAKPLPELAKGIDPKLIAIQEAKKRQNMLAGFQNVEQMRRNFPNGPMKRRSPLATGAKIAGAASTAYGLYEGVSALYSNGINIPKYSSGGIVKNIDQITASSRGYSSGGVVNMNSGGPVGGGVSSSIDGLGSKMDDFINKLTGAIPTSVSMEGNHNISASITGGHQLQSLLEGPFSEIVRNAINNAFATRSQQNEGSTA
jgi:hypothetical protein